MIGSVVAALVIFGQAPSPGRFEVGERVKELDQAWLATTDRTRRTAAVPKISGALAAFFNSKYGEACRLVDEATAALNGQAPSSGDAISLRFDPPFAEPKTPAKLKLTWAYMPATTATVRVTVGRQTVVATPGRPLTIDVRPEQINPDILQNPEVGYLMPVQIGPDQRNVFLSIIKHPRERLAALRSTKNPEAKTLVEFLDKAFNDPETLENDYPLIQYLFTAELLDEGRLRLDRADSLPLVKSGDTYFRAVFPRAQKGPLNVVIGLHGMGGSENMFFDSYGRGIAVSESLKRGWAFIAPRSSRTAVADVLQWLKTRRKQAVGRVFVMGHSLGGGTALLTGDVKPRPSAIALFAPAAQSIPSNMAEIPIFVAAGKQDLMFSAAKGIANQLVGRRDCEFLELDPCEHLMVVADAVPAAFRFFDARVGR